MNSVREIKVTESYLGLDQSVKACKDEEEPQHDCTTSLFTNASLTNCGCLPLSIRNDKKVSMFKKLMIDLFLIVYSILCALQQSWHVLRI